MKSGLPALSPFLFLIVPAAAQVRNQVAVSMGIGYDTDGLKTPGVNRAHQQFQVHYRYFYSPNAAIGVFGVWDDRTIDTLAIVNALDQALFKRETVYEITARSFMGQSIGPEWTYALMNKRRFYSMSISPGIFFASKHPLLVTWNPYDTSAFKELHVAVVGAKGAAPGFIGNLNLQAGFGPTELMQFSVEYSFSYIRVNVPGLYMEKSDLMDKADVYNYSNKISLFRHYIGIGLLFNIEGIRRIMR